MNKNRSVATIDAPEFINLEPNAINPGISQCEIKVFYLGKNRNGSFINKNTAIQMANSLPGTPIVGAYRKDIEDFGDHGHVMHIEDGEVTFSCKTIPYGFVKPDAQVWFQMFKDTDEFGNDIEREYLMTEGYLWTRQFPEVESCINEGKGHSMELDPDNLDGHWASDNNSGIEFFIINDAIFSKLCILGDDVEPCFEGSSVTSPQISKNFSKDPEFSRTLFTMMNELTFALQNKGGSDMPKPQDAAVENAAVETSEEVEVNFTDTSAGTDNSDGAETSEDFAKKEEEGKEEKKDEKSDDSKSEEPKDEDDEDKKKKFAKEEEEEDEDKKPACKHSTEDFAALQSQLEALNAELETLREFKAQKEEAEKTALIDKYHMLSEEDKADVIAHQSEYSLHQIDAELALIYVQKNVDFSTVDGKFEEAAAQEEDPITTFSLESESAGFVPSVVEALRKTKSN